MRAWFGIGAQTLALLIGATAAIAQITAQVDDTPDEVRAGSRVKIRYTRALLDGSVLDTHVSGEPLELVQGSKDVIPGISEAVLGMKVGDFKQVTVPPEKAYGPVNPEAFRPVPRSMLPPDSVPGTELGSEDATGRPILMRVVRFEGDDAILDFNHPLAGKTLVFDIEVVGIE